MAELIQTLIRPFWQLLILIPMPWRSAIIVLLLIPILSWLFLRAFPWLIAQLSQILLLVKMPEFVFSAAQWFGAMLLYPEYLITRYIRKRGSQPPLFIYIFGNMVIAMMNVIAQASQPLDKILRKGTKILNYAIKKRFLPSRNLLLIVTSFLLLAWYVRPNLDENEATKLIDNGVISWYSLEDWVLDGNLKHASLNNPSPKEFIIDYFSVINKQHYTVAWNSVSEQYKNKTGGYKRFLDWWEHKVDGVELYGVSLKLQNRASATINVILQYSMRDTRRKSKTELIRYNLVWDTQNNRWLINDSDYLEK